MGSLISTLISPLPLPPPRFSIDDLPENCIALMYMKLDAVDVCRLAGLSRVFWGAASADFVWESKLPENYGFLVRKLFDEVPERLRKKDVYSMLLRPIRFDAATKEIWLDKSTGKMCMAISWKGMRITGIDDRRYWSHLPSEESRFHTIAYLQQVWWLEVSGELEFTFPVGSFGLFFRLQKGKPTNRNGRRACNLDQVHGWDSKPLRFELSASNGQHAVSQWFLKQTGNWGYYHVGDFTVENPSTPFRIKYSMSQIDCTHTKGGLCLDSVVICPCELKERLLEW
ncbi:F-box protein PP2-A13-like protein [Drosera capensis]